MRAVLTFDAEAEAHKVPKRLRKTILDMNMDNSDGCYTRMERKYDASLRPAIQRTFESG